MSKETKVDKAIIALNAIDKLSELKEPRNALFTGLLHCNDKLKRELPIDKQQIIGAHFDAVFSPAKSTRSVPTIPSKIKASGIMA